MPGEEHGRDIYNRFFKSAQAVPRGAVATLANIVTQIELALEEQCAQHLKTTKSVVIQQPAEPICVPEMTWQERLRAALQSLSKLLQEDGVISAYEMYSSGWSRRWWRCSVRTDGRRD